MWQQMIAEISWSIGDWEGKREIAASGMLWEKLTLAVGSEVGGL